MAMGQSLTTQQIPGVEEIFRVSVERFSMWMRLGSIPVPPGIFASHRLRYNPLFLPLAPATTTLGFRQLCR